MARLARLCRLQCCLVFCFSLCFLSLSSSGSSPLPYLTFSLASYSVVDGRKFVSELVRVAAPGGRILIVTWCHRVLTPENPELSADEQALLDRLGCEMLCGLGPLRLLRRGKERGRLRKIMPLRKATVRRAGQFGG